MNRGGTGSVRRMLQILLVLCLIPVFPGFVGVSQAEQRDRTDQPHQVEEKVSEMKQRGKIENLTITPASNIAGKPNVEYQVSFTLGEKTRLGKNSEITFFAEPGVLPTSIAAGKILVNGVATTRTAKGNGKSISFLSPVSLNEKENVTITFLGGEDGAALYNPTPGKRSFGISAKDIDYTAATYTFEAASLEQVEIVPATQLPDERDVEYTVSFHTGEATLLIGDTINLSTDAPIFTKSVIPPKTVSINGKVIKNAIKVKNSNSLELELSDFLNAGQSVQILFAGGSKGAGLKNPPAGEYVFSLSTTNHAVTETKVSYQVERSVPEEFTVSPGSLIAGEKNVEYRITFNSGKAKLLQGDWITLTAPQGVFPKKSIAAGKVVLNGNPIQQEVASDGRQVRLFLPSDINAGEPVEIVFVGGSNGAGLSNPAAGNSSFAVETSRHKAATASVTFVDAPQEPVSDLMVTPASDYAGELDVEYRIRFQTGKTKLQKGDTITLTMPAGVLPNEPIPAQTISVNGVKLQESVRAADANNITLTIPQEIPAHSEVEVLFAGGVEGAGLSNPGAGTYWFALKTSRHPEKMVSYTFVEAPSSIAEFQVAPLSDQAGEENVEYTLSFVSRFAYQKGEALVFTTPAGMFTKSVIPAGTITVNGVPTDAPSKGNGRNYVKVTLPAAIPAKTKIEIRFPGGSDGAGLRNPGMGNKSFGLIMGPHKATTTASFTGVPVTMPSLSVSSRVAGMKGVEYRFGFTVSRFGKLSAGDYIYVYTPGGVLPNGVIPAGKIMVNGVPTTVDVKTYPNYVAIPSPVQVKGEQPIEIRFVEGSDGANLRNPGAGQQTFLVWTTYDARATVLHTFDGSPVANASMVPSSVTGGESGVEFTFEFTTGPYGDLAAGQSIFVYAPAGVLPAVPVIPAGKILVNDQPTTADAKAYGTYVNIPVPTAIGPNQPVRVKIVGGPDGVAMRNPGAGVQKFLIWTTYEGRATIAYSFTGPSVQEAWMTPASTAAGEKDVEYRFGFTTGSNGDLAVGQSIYVYAPAGVFPAASTIPAGKILVNGQPTTADAKAYGTYVNIPVPTPIGANQPVEVTFVGGAEGAHLRNPGAGVQKFLVWTTYDGRTTISQTFEGMTVQNLTVTPSSGVAGQADVEYTFGFVSSPYGDLNTGQSLFVYAPAGVLPSGPIPAGKILVNGQPTTVEAKTYGTYVNIPIPAPIGASQPIEVKFAGGPDGAHLRNPGAGAQKFLAWTTYDGRATVAYTFEGVPIQNLAMSVSSTQPGQADVEYRFTFTTTENGALSPGQAILVAMPAGVLPASPIAPGNILINGVPTTAAAKGNGSTYVSIPVPTAIGAGQSVTVTFPGGADGARLINPKAGTYSFAVWTTYDKKTVVTQAYGKNEAGKLSRQKQNVIPLPAIPVMGEDPIVIPELPIEVPDEPVLIPEEPLISFPDEGAALPFESELLRQLN